MFLPHLKHTLRAFQESFDHLHATIRADLVLTLTEATRFPNMAWKRFTIDQAEAAAHGLNDRYLHSSIAQFRCLLSRISGNIKQAIANLDNLNSDRSPDTEDKRMHSVIGQVTIQCSLN